MAAIIITDLRAIPVSAAIDLKRRLKEKNPCLLVASEIVSNRDYGQEDHVVIRRMKVFALKLLWGAEIVRSGSRAPTEEAELTGVRSSLLSITNDSLASKEKYPVLYASLLALHNGAEALAKEVLRRNEKEVYLFNGRLASSYAISKAAHEYGIKSYFYEYGRLPRHYTLTDFPQHRLSQWGDELVKFYKRNIISHAAVTKMADCYRHLKLSNQFTKYYGDEAADSYDVAIFLSSSHEFMALDETLCNITYKSELDFVKEVVQTYGPKLSYIVRCHPNQSRDPSWKDVLGPLMAFCEENSIRFVGPDSALSSYAIIKKSQKVAVYISSIGIDAVLLGKQVEVFGNPDYKAPMDYLQSQAASGEEARECLSRVMSLRDLLFQQVLGRTAMAWWLVCDLPARVLRSLNKAG